jgi:nitrogen regulatory protein PII
MPAVKAVLVTIIAESGLVPNLKDLVKRAGATGYTIEEVAAGFGTHGHRSGNLESDQTTKMLLVVSQPVAHRIFEEIERTLEPLYAITVFRHEVEVLMPLVGH